MSEVALAVDVGGTKLLAGLVTRTGEIIESVETSTPRSAAGADPGLVAFLASAHELAERARAGGHVVRAAGAGFPEYVRDDALTSAEVVAWERQPAAVLSDVVPGVPVVIEGDVRCAAVAEAHARGASGLLFYVSWGTGLSSTIVLDGVPLPSRRGEALALGEWPVSARVEPAWDGNLEQYAAGRSLGRRYAVRAGAEVDGRTVVERAEAGEPVATDVVESAARALAHALAQVVHVLDPDLIVLGGGLGTSGSRPPALVAELLPTLLHRQGPAPVEPARTGPQAGLVGAALLAHRAADAE